MIKKVSACIICLTTPASRLKLFFLLVSFIFLLSKLPEFQNVTGNSVKTRETFFIDLAVLHTTYNFCLVSLYLNILPFFKLTLSKNGNRAIECQEKEICEQTTV